ncbi:uncharacterized protein LOC109827223 [Asparagus officinalis]|uniref:uncharacterized protein LOC109827223 n=1 Tax=Asparagus officinalis TaxID=4686 RepID=UPI00098E22BE|nr:uncharacterized protein LOC109827223 [Asparagus officinalis]
MVLVSPPDTPVSRCNHFGNSESQDPLMLHIFRGNVPLFYAKTSEVLVEFTGHGSEAILKYLIIDAKISIHEEDQSGKPHFLFGDCNPGVNYIFNMEKERLYYA